MHADPGVRRILMTADAVGGVWTYSLDLAAGLTERGIQVTLAVMGPQPRLEQRAEANARGIEVVHSPFRLEWMADPWADVERAGAWLLTLAHRVRPDLVHLNGFCHAALPWRVPVVVVAHSCVRTWWRGVHGEDAPGSWDTYSARVGEGLRRASVVIAPTRALLDDVRSEYGVSGPASVIPNGSRAVERPRSTAPKEHVIFAAGRLWDPAKNFEALSAVAASVSWPVCLAGAVDGPGGRFAADGGARYLGELTPAAMQEWYERAAVYALPARYEPFGLSIVEAAAAGCALVLGDIRTLRENWSGAAVFVPPDNRRALASALEDLIREPDRRTELGARARDLAARFTVDSMCDAYVALYASLGAPVAA